MARDEYLTVSGPDNFSIQYAKKNGVWYAPSGEPVSDLEREMLEKEYLEQYKSQ